MPLLTAAQARDKLPAQTGTGEDTLLDTLILGVGGAFARHCGYPSASAGAEPTMLSTAYTRYFDGPGGRDLYLDVWPVTAITSIEDDPDRDFDGTSHLVASSDYNLRKGEYGHVILKSTATHGRWLERSGCIKAVFTAGFSSAPATLSELAKHAVRHAYDLRATQGKTNASQGGVSIGFRDEDFLPALVRQGLGTYRLPTAIL